MSGRPAELLPATPTATPAAATPGGQVSGVGVVQEWRGTLVPRIEVSSDGRLARLKIVDPSFMTWPALPVALTDTIVPDFPLINKRFNLAQALPATHEGWART